MATFDDPGARTRYVQVVFLGWQPASGVYWVQVFRAPDNGTGSPDTASEILVGTYGPNRTEHHDYTGGQALAVPWWHYRIRHIHPTDTNITPGPYTGYIRAIGVPGYFDPVRTDAASYGNVASVPSTQIPALTQQKVVGPSFSFPSSSTDAASYVTVMQVAAYFTALPLSGIQQALGVHTIIGTTSTEGSPYGVLSQLYVASTYDRQLMGSFYALGLDFVSTGVTVTNRYGYRIGDVSTAGTVTNNYGVYCDALDSGTNNFAFYMAGAGNVGLFGASTLGGGTNVMTMANTTSVPTSTSVSGGGILFVSSGALRWLGSSGTVTTLGPA